MTVKTAPEREIYIHGRTRNFTMDEYSVALKAAIDAHERGDEEEYDRLTRNLPIVPGIAKAWKIGFGKQYLLEMDVDLTEANLVYGKGWLDEPED